MTESYYVVNTTFIRINIEYDTTDGKISCIKGYIPSLLSSQPDARASVYISNSTSRPYERTYVGTYNNVYESQLENARLVFIVAPNETDERYFDSMCSVGTAPPSTFDSAFSSLILDDIMNMCLFNP